MDEQGISKIGARALKDDEIKQILPTYKELLQQIEQMHQHVLEITHPSTQKADNGKNQEAGKEGAFFKVSEVFGADQVTNNISIIGPRGSGKTSVMKTLFQRLGEDPKRNVILPGIVPENMADSMELMSSILGLFAEPVEGLVKRAKESNKLCVPSQIKEETAYRKLVQNFGFQQSDYNKISVNNFSTEAGHVSNRIQIFKAANRFPEQLSEFIDMLLSNFAPDALLFLFIDDIDLSTSRCIDVVKTLLSYLAHPRIVTILSGDLSTFEEALTLDFIRQERIFHADAMQQSYLRQQKTNTKSTNPQGESSQENTFPEDETSLLQRKMTLSYEYLKKIMPPLYRHHIAAWSLETRGAFSVKVESNEDLTLIDLLLAIGNKNPLLRNGFQFTPLDAAANQKPASIPQFFHIFDSTARGLSNVYQGLWSMNEKLRQMEASLPTTQTDLLKKEEQAFLYYQQAKILLETMVTANPTLNTYRTLIFESILRFGVDLDRTTIHFENLPDYNPSSSPTHYFTLFTYLDFACRLLKMEQVLQSTAYLKKKILAVQQLCAVPDISGRSVGLDTDQKKVIEELSKKASTSTSAEYSKNPSGVLLVESLFRFSFFESLLFYQMFLVQDVLKGTKHQETVPDGTKKGPFTAVESEFDRISNCMLFYRFLCLLSTKPHDGESKVLISIEHLKDHTEMIALLENVLQSNRSAMLLDILFSDYYYPKSSEPKSPLFSNYLTNLESDPLPSLDELANYEIRKETFDYIQIPGADNGHKSIYFKNPTEIAGVEAANLKFRRTAAVTPLYNYISNTYIDKLLSEQAKQIRSLSDYDWHNNTSFVHDDDKKRQKLLVEIDKQELWNHPFSDEARKFIVKELQSLENEKSPNLVDLSELYKYYTETFLKSEDGDSDTLSKKCKRLMQECFEFAISTSSTTPCFSNIAIYLLLRRIVERLARSSAWYGVSEANKMLELLNKVSLHDDIFSEEEQQQYLFWLHCYCRMQLARHGSGIYRLLDQAEGCLNTIYQSRSHHNQEQILDYQTQLEAGVGSELAKEFKTLFSKIRKQEKPT